MQTWRNLTPKQRGKEPSVLLLPHVTRMHHKSCDLASIMPHDRWGECGPEGQSVLGASSQSSKRPYSPSPRELSPKELSMLLMRPHWHDTGQTTLGILQKPQQPPHRCSCFRDYVSTADCHPEARRADIHIPTWILLLFVWPLMHRIRLFVVLVHVPSSLLPQACLGFMYSSS